MELFCEYSHFSSFSSDEIIYKCKVIGINRIASNGRVLNIHGTHHEGKFNTDVQALTIFDHQIDNFPRYLCNFFPNLKSISIISCGLKTLTKFDLIGCEGIEKLMLNGNQIKTVELDVFDYAKNLEIISFFMNQIQFVPENVFDGLKKLKYVNFKLNSRIDWCCKDFGAGGNFLAEIKKNLRKDFGDKTIVGSAHERMLNFFEAFAYLENYRDSVEIEMEGKYDGRIHRMVGRM